MVALYPFLFKLSRSTCLRYHQKLRSSCLQGVRPHWRQLEDVKGSGKMVEGQCRPKGGMRGSAQCIMDNECKLPCWSLGGDVGGRCAYVGSRTLLEAIGKS